MRPWVFPGPLFCGPEEKTFSNKKEVPMSPEKITTRIHTTFFREAVKLVYGTAFFGLRFFYICTICAAPQA